MLRTAGCLGFLLALAAVGMFVRTIEFERSRSWVNGALAAVAAAASLYFLRALIGGIRDTTAARIVPYFQARLGLDASSPFSRGAALARHCRSLDELGTRLGVAPISAFGFNDDAAGERVTWYLSSAGLETVVALKNHLQTAAHDEELLRDLAALEAALEEAAKQEVSFCFILRPGRDEFISPPEMDRREGSFW